MANQAVNATTNREYRVEIGLLPLASQDIFSGEFYLPLQGASSGKLEQGKTVRDIGLAPELPELKAFQAHGSHKELLAAMIL